MKIPIAPRKPPCDRAVFCHSIPASSPRFLSHPKDGQAVTQTHSRKLRRGFVRAIALDLLDLLITFTPGISRSSLY
jgi:hypothetical protein